MKRNTRYGLADLITGSLLQAEADGCACARDAAHVESGAVTNVVASAETINPHIAIGAVRGFPRRQALCTRFPIPLSSFKDRAEFPRSRRVRSRLPITLAPIAGATPDLRYDSLRSRRQIYADLDRHSHAALAEAKAGGCNASLWFELAKAREKDHFADAAEIYCYLLDDIVKQSNNRAYDEAAALVKKVRSLMRRTEQEKEFAAWLDAARVKHKATRNFMQRLDAIQ